MTFHETSYRKHSERKDELKDFNAWKQKDTVDYWRHKRMYDNLIPLIKSYPKSKWLTLGDGRFGTDANYLESFGLDVLATDISTENLNYAKEIGFIKACQTENAEKLSFPDNAFDFVLCKESYHHFPRPMVALYEMIRVSKIGVVLIEPNDYNISSSVSPRLLPSFSQLWQSIKNEIKIAMGKKPYYHFGNYEESGNYVFSISEREIEKVALGIDLPTVIFRGQDDHYIEGVEEEKIAQQGPLYQKVKKNIDSSESKSRKGFKNFGLLVAGVFKDELSGDCQQSLLHAGFTVKNLPRNPFVKGH